VPSLHPFVSLHDVEDVHAFVHGTLVRFERDSEFELTEPEREELHAEGMCILFELASKYEHQRPGYDRPGRFSGFAAMFLPRRLGDAWHRMHEEHRYVTRADGKREWRYFKRTISLNGLYESEKGGGDADGDFAAPSRVDGRLLGADKWVPVAEAA
jgi:hypothetical protein